MNLSGDQVRSIAKSEARPINERLTELETEVDALTAGTLQEVTDQGNTTSDDIEITDDTKGLILTSPDLTRWRITVEDAGTLTITDLTPPP